MKPATKWVVPAIAIFVFTSGLLNVVSAIGLGSRLRIRLLEYILPWSVLSASRSLTLIAGVFLIFLAGGLWQRKKRAMRLSLGLLSFSLVLHLLKGLDFEEALVLLIPINLLFVFNDEFMVESSGLKFFEAMRNSLVVLVLLFVYAFFGFYLFQGQFRQPVTTTVIVADYEYSVFGVGSDALIPRTRGAEWFGESVTFVGAAALIFIFANLFAPALRLGEVSKEDRDWVRELISRYGENSVDYFALMSDKSYFFSPSRKSVIAYKVATGVVVALSGPIGVSEDKMSCLSEFVVQMKRRGLSILFYNLTEEGRRLAAEAGLKTIKIGEQAVIKTGDFVLSESAFSEIRHAVTRVEREGVIFKVSSFAQASLAMATDLANLHQEWLSTKKIPPITFSSDYFPLPVESEAFLVMAYNKEGKLLAALSFLPYKAGKGLVLDLMLRSADAFNGLMEGVIAYSVEYFKNMGKTEVSLSMAPLANVGYEKIFRHFSSLYRYQPLLAFKKKFNPDWEPAYLAYEQGTALPRVSLALLRVSLKSKEP